MPSPLGLKDSSRTLQDLSHFSLLCFDFEEKVRVVSRFTWAVLSSLLCVPLLMVSDFQKNKRVALVTAKVTHHTKHYHRLLGQSSFRQLCPYSVDAKWQYERYFYCSFLYSSSFENRNRLGVPFLIIMGIIFLVKMTDNFFKMLPSTCTARTLATICTLSKSFLVILSCLIHFWYPQKHYTCVSTLWII